MTSEGTKQIHDTNGFVKNLELPQVYGFDGIRHVPGKRNPG